MKSISASPIRVLTVAVIVTVLLFGGFCLQLWNSYRDLKTVQTFYIRLQELAGTIIHYDEILTMSARMGAVTGNMEWEEKYRKYEPLLDTMIKEAMALTPKIFMSDAAAETDAANSKLVAMENQAFDLIRHGKSEAAVALLFSNEYEREKEIYSNGMKKVTAKISERVDSTRKAQRQRSFLLFVFTAVTLTIVGFAWFGILRLVARYVTAQKKAEEALRRSQSELEKKVEERTTDLRIANVQLLQENIQRQKAEHKLIQYQNQLKGLASQLTLAEERSRRSFAGYLHDNIGQQLLGIKINLELLKDSLSLGRHRSSLGETVEALQKVIDHARSLTYELSPPVLYQFGIEAALEWLAKHMEERHNISVTLEDDSQEKPLLDEVKVFLFQAVRELLTNIVKHAQAQNVRISIENLGDHVQIRVKDDGVGFNSFSTCSPQGKDDGFGLFNIKERLEQFGGRFNVESSPNIGTLITLSAPVNIGN